MQESFYYLSVLLAVVLGLAITQVLLGLRGLILTRAKLKPYFPTLIWAMLTLLIAFQGTRYRDTFRAAIKDYLVQAKQCLPKLWPTRYSLRPSTVFQKILDVRNERSRLFD
jgi:hypothetical protein